MVLQQIYITVDIYFSIRFLSSVEHVFNVYLESITCGLITSQ